MSSTNRGDMSMHESRQHQDLPLDGIDRDPAGYLKYVPALTFGLRVAALAGLAAGVAEAAALSGIFDAPTVVAGGESTCCITKH